MTYWNQSENFSTSGNAYENAMKNILKKRTGKSFQRNLESAPVPVQENQLSHEEVTNQIFDNIIRRKQEAAESAQTEVEEPETLPEEARHEDEPTLDQILWPDQVEISEQTQQSASEFGHPVYDNPTEHVDALARQYAAELDEILGFD